MVFPDVTILIEGRLDDGINLGETLKVYRDLGKIIISIYKEDTEKVKGFCEGFDVVIIENDEREYRKVPLRIDPRFKDHTAISLLKGFFKICAIRKGLAVVNDGIVIVTRMDNFYGGMDKFIEKGLEDRGKITSLSLFVRGIRDGNLANRARFCLSDNLFMGPVGEIKKCFDLCYENKMLTRVATGIWEPYFVDLFKDVDISDDELYVKAMMEKVKIVCVNEIGVYGIRYFDTVRNYMWDRVKGTREYLEYGCDC